MDFGPSLTRSTLTFLLSNSFISIFHLIPFLFISKTKSYQIKFLKAFTSVELKILAFNISKNYFICFNTQFHKNPASIHLFFQLAKHYSFFKILISFSLPLCHKNPTKGTKPPAQLLPGKTTHTTNTRFQNPPLTKTSKPPPPPLTKPNSNPPSSLPNNPKKIATHNYHPAKQPMATH